MFSIILNAILESLIFLTAPGRITLINLQSRTPSFNLDTNCAEVSIYINKLINTQNYFYEELC